MAKVTKLIDGIEILEGLFLLDSRGYFYEKYDNKFLDEKKIKFVQENISKSKKGTVRGLHWQVRPKSQNKLVTCISGKIMDVAVDLRMNSKTFGQYCSVILKGSENRSMWIPEGFAHGFQALTSDAIISYSVTSEYSKEKSKTINPLCPEINIAWPLQEVILSENDASAPKLNEILDQKIFF